MSSLVHVRQGRYDFELTAAQSARRSRTTPPASTHVGYWACSLGHVMGSLVRARQGRYAFEQRAARSAALEDSTASQTRSAGHAQKSRAMAAAAAPPLAEVLQLGLIHGRRCEGERMTLDGSRRWPETCTACLMM